MRMRTTTQIDCVYKMTLSSIKDLEDLQRKERNIKKHMRRGEELTRLQAKAKELKLLLNQLQSEEKIRIVTELLLQEKAPIICIDFFGEGKKPLEGVSIAA